MTNKMLDIIIPYYNIPDIYFDWCLHSVTSQTAANKIQVTVVDDCSPSNCMSIVTKYQNDNNINVLRPKHNLGSGMARQYGIDNTNCPFFMLLDGDDCLFNMSTIELLLPQLYDENKVIAGIKINSYTNVVKQLQIFSSWDTQVNALIYNRRYIDDMGYRFYTKDNAYRDHGDDYVFNLEFKLDNQKGIEDVATFINMPISLYTIRDNSLSIYGKSKGPDIAAMIGKYSNSLVMLTNIDNTKPFYINELNNLFQLSIYEYIVTEPQMTVQEKQDYQSLLKDIYSFVKDNDKINTSTCLIKTANGALTTKIRASFNDVINMIKE